MGAFLAKTGCVVFLLAVAAIVLCPDDSTAAISSGAGGDGNACTAAVAKAERDYRIPAYLLQAIALAESGRHNETTGAMRAWPWTVMAEGKGRYFDSRREAIAAVKAVRARGVSNIDVGCMQINLRHHPDAFTSLDEAFDPVANAAYAGRFLAALERETGSWEKAAGRYHSATVKFNRPYREKIMRLWAKAKEQGTPVGPSRAIDSLPDARSDVTVLSGNRRSPIDRERVAMLNANHRAAVSGRAGKKGVARDAFARSQLPLVSAARSHSSRRTPRVLRGGRGQTIDPSQFEVRRRQQLAAWRTGRGTSARGITVLRGDPNR